MKTIVKSVLFALLIIFITSIIAFADTDKQVTIDPSYDVDDNKIEIAKGLKVYKTVNVYGADGYEKQWTTLHYSNIKYDMLNQSEGGFPYYSHGQYLDSENPLVPESFSFENMMKIKQNATGTIGSHDTSIQYYIDNIRAHGFPNYKDRSGRAIDGTRIAQKKGSGHFPNPFFDSTGVLKGEWRYLGYLIDGSYKTMANPFFPDDYPTTNSNPGKRDFQENPWNFGLGIEKSEYNKVITPEGIDTMKRFISFYKDFQTNSANTKFWNEMRQAKTDDDKARVMLRYFAVQTRATDKSAGMITGVHSSGGSYYYISFVIPAKIPPENTNLKIACPVQKVIDGKTYNNGSMVDDQNIMRNSVEIYEVNSDGSRGKLISNMPIGGLKEGQYNAELTANKEYEFVAYVRHYDLAPQGQAPRQTTEPIKLFKHYEYNKKTNPSESAFVYDSQEFDSQPNEQFNNKPLVVGKIKIFAWREKLPASINGAKTTELKLTVNLSGKTTLPDGTIISYPKDNIFTKVDDSSTINIKIKDSLPNLTVASATHSVVDNNKITREKIEIYPKDEKGNIDFSKNLVMKTATGGFDAYLPGGQEYVLRTYISNNTTIPPHDTKGNVTAGIEFIYNSNKTGNYYIMKPTEDSLQRRSGDIGIFKGSPIPNGQTEMIEYSFMIPDKIDNSKADTLKITTKIVNEVNCAPEDNTILTDDDSSVLIKIGLPDIPNLKALSSAYPDKDDAGTLRNKIEVVKKGTTAVLDPLKDKLVPGTTYTFTSYVKYIPSSTQKTTKATSTLVDRTYICRAGETGDKKTLTAPGQLNNTNHTTAKFVEDVTIPKDANTNITYGIKINAVHNGVDNNIFDDDTVSTVFQLIGGGARNLSINKIDVMKQGSSTVLRPGVDSLKVGDTYTFKVYMKYVDNVTQQPSITSGIKCDYDMYTDNMSYGHDTSISNTSKRLSSTNYPSAKIPHGQTSTFTFTKQITQAMGTAITFKAIVPTDYYLIDNYDTSDDEYYVTFNIGNDDLEMQEAVFYKGSTAVDTLTLNTMHSVKFRVVKNQGSKPVVNVQIYAQVLDANNNVLAGQFLTGNKTLKNIGDYQDFQLNNLLTNSGAMTAKAYILPIHNTRGENWDLTNDTTEKTITDEIDLGIESFKVNPMKLDVASGDTIKPQTISFNVQITNANKKGQMVGNGTSEVAFVIKDKYGRELVKKYLALPPNISAGFSFPVTNYTLGWGNNDFYAEINPYRTIKEISSTHADPYWNNTATASTLVRTNDAPIVCEKGLTTVKQNSWHETFYMVKRWGTKHTYDCSYTNAQGRYIKRTCYYCDPDNWKYWDTTKNFTEKFSVSAVYFRSQYTQDKYGGDGWVNILNGQGEVRPGSGFEVRIQTNYKTNRDVLPYEPYYSNECNYLTVNPGKTPIANVDRITVTIPQFKDSKGEQVAYSMYPLKESGGWADNTKEFQFPLRNAFGIENNRKIYVNENVTVGATFQLKITTDKFAPYDSSQGQKYLQDCVSTSVRITDNEKTRTHIVD